MAALRWLTLAVGISACCAEHVAVHVNDCAPLVGADFACGAHEGQNVDSCQVRTRKRAEAACRALPVCTAVAFTEAWGTLRAPFNFSIGNETQRAACIAVADTLRAGLTACAPHSPRCLRMACKWSLLTAWKRHQCSSIARPVDAVRSMVAARPASIGEVLDPASELSHYRCALSRRVVSPKKVQPQGDLCMRPPPAAGQCSLLRRHALKLCSQMPQCRVLQCGRASDHCQAFRDDWRLANTATSFGEVDVFVKDDGEGAAANTVAGELCARRHYLAIGASFGPASAYHGPPMRLECSGATCRRETASGELVEGASERLRQLLVTGENRFSTRATYDEPDVLSVLSPLLLYPPAPLLLQAGPNVSAGGVLSAAERPLGSKTLDTERVTDREAERLAYHALYSRDKWLFDVQHVWERFYSSWAAGRAGFFIEAGAVQGTIYDSNSMFFERFLGWTGLLVEANPFSFARLLTHRPAAYRVETALCKEAGTLRFMLPEKRNADGCCGAVSPEGRHVMRCTPLGPILRLLGVKRVDFWSLDVEGAEMSVLEGFDWGGVELGVLLIEMQPRPATLKPSLQRFLASKGLKKLDGFTSPTTLNEVWYDPKIITPTPAGMTANPLTGEWKGGDKTFKEKSAPVAKSSNEKAAKAAKVAQEIQSAKGTIKFVYKELEKRGLKRTSATVEDIMKRVKKLMAYGYGSHAGGD